MNESRFAALLAEYHATLRTDTGNQADKLPPPHESLSPEEAAEFSAAQQWIRMLDVLWQHGGQNIPMSPHSTLSRESGQRIDEFAGKLHDTQRFTIVRPLGSGGMGMVYEAFDRVRQERVALKTVRQATPESVLRLKNEFRALADIQHPNLVSLHELHRDGEQWFFSMELVDGWSFTDFFRDPRPPLDLSSAILQLASGLAALHEGGWLHRDIKPSNVLVTASLRVVILDFGLRLALNGGECRTSRAAGTWTYMSPEQSAALPLSPASDLYSVGVMLYEVLTGTPPFRENALNSLYARQYRDPIPPKRLRPDISPQLNRLCMGLLQRSPTHRPTIRKIQQQLQPAISQLVGPGTPVRADITPDHPGFVGRQHELERLRKAAESVRSGNAAHVFLQGNSGFGKTSLAHEFLRQIWAPGVFIVQGRCYQNESVPYKAWDELMDTFVDQMLHRRTSAIESIADRDWQALLRLFPTLQRLRPAPNLPTEIDTEPATVRRHAAKTLRQLFSRLAQEVTLILFIDDLHWADTDSAVLMTEVLHGEQSPQLLFVGTFRTEEEFTSPCLQSLLNEDSNPWKQSCVQIAVGPLQPTDAKKLIRRMLRDGSYNANDRAAHVLRESEGHPWLIVAIIQELRRGDAHRRIPASFKLNEVLASRIHELSSPARSLLNTICLSAQPLSEAIAYRCAGLGVDRDAMCGELHRTQLVRHTWNGGKKRLAPYHDRIREICQQKIAESEAVQLHVRLAEQMELEPGSDPQSIAMHYQYGGKLDRATLFFERAGDRAADALAFGLAADCYGQAAHLSVANSQHRHELMEKRADCLANAGRGAQAANEYQILARLVPEETKARQLRRAAAYHLCVSGHIAEGKAAFAQVLRPLGFRLFRSRWPIALLWSFDNWRLAQNGLHNHVRPVDHIPTTVLERIDVTWEVAIGMTMIDTLQGGLFQSRNLRLAIKAGEPRRLARACAWQATYQSTLGTHQAAHVDGLLSTATKLCAGLQDPYLDGLLLLSHGICDYFFGRWESASTRCIEAAKQFRNQCRGVAWETNTSYAFMLWSLYFQGRVQEMSARLPELLDEAQSRGDRLTQASLCNFGGPLAWLSQDRPEQALAALQSAMQLWPANEFHVQHFTYLAGIVQVHLYRGEVKRAWDDLQQHWPALKRSFYLHIEAIRIFMLHLRARTALAWALESRAPKAIRQARADANRLLQESAPWAAPLAHLVLAGLASLQGNHEAAITRFQQAATGLRDCQLHLFSQAAERAIATELGQSRGRTREEIDRDLRAKGIVHPQAICQMHAPYQSSVGPS